MEILITLLKYFFIPFLMVVFILLTLFIILGRLSYDHSIPYRENVTYKSEIFFTEMILAKPDKNTLNIKLNEFTNAIPLNKNWCKELVINDMIRLKRNLKGKAADSIIVFYRALKLNNYSSGLMRNFLDLNKCEGLYQFQSLDYKNSIDEIKPFLQSSNKIIRSNATMAYISLTDGDMSVFNEFPRKISLLNIIKIMDIYHERKLPIPKNIDDWIDSANTTVIILGIKTMVFYNYLNKSDAIIELVKHEDEAIKKEAIIAIRDLYLYESERLLIKVFETSSLENKFEIVKTLKIIGNQEAIEFLKNVIDTEVNLDLKLQAVACLNQLDFAALDMMVIPNPDLKKMIMHVRNKYIV